MDKSWCPLPADRSFRLASAGLLALTVTGGSLVLYCWNGRKEAAIKRQVAKLINDRKSRVAAQKEVMKKKSGNMDEKLRKHIVNLSSDELLKEMAALHFTALQVLQAYQAESYEVDLRTNCITEYLEDAEELANAVDNTRAKGPLHGLPISVKENINIKGLDCTSGVAYLLDKPCAQDATIVAVLKQLGAVPFTRTNIVQTTCSFGNSNPIYGATMSPHNPKRIPGGSTCGEGALIGGRGSLIGLGTDVGGSVRIPAAMSGHFSLKPTQRRISGDGIKPSAPGITGLHDCPGIMSREIQAIITVFKALVTSNMFDMDPKVIPLPFQEKVFNSKNALTIGYYEDDGIVGPTPGCRRAVRVAKAILEKMGHNVVPFKLPNVTKAYELTMAFAGVDGGQGLEDALRYEPEIDACLSFVNKSVIHRLREAITGKKQLPVLGTTVTAKSAYELWQLMAEREDYLQLFIQTMKTQQIDAILAPGYAMPGSTPDFIISTGPTIFITMMYNMLNFPAGAIPVTKENLEDQSELENYPTPGELQKKMKEATKGATGMPLGVQIIGLPWQEELVLRLMKELDRGIRTRYVPDEPLPPIMEKMA